MLAGTVNSTSISLPDVIENEYQSCRSLASIQPVLVVEGFCPSDLEVAEVFPASPATPASDCTCGQGALPPALSTVLTPSNSVIGTSNSCFSSEFRISTIDGATSFGTNGVNNAVKNSIPIKNPLRMGKPQIFSAQLKHINVRITRTPP